MLPITAYWSGVRIKAYEYPNGKLALFHRPNISGGIVLMGDWAVGKANGGWEGRVNRFNKQRSEKPGYALHPLS